MNEQLKAYRSKRDFAATPEPAPDADEAVAGGSGAGLSFVVQKHAASHLHYDFRLELDGTLKSWAVPKGPSLDPSVRRMAVHVEDHPISYGGFEGVIPAGHYGAGTVIVWDRGTWLPVGDAAASYRSGKLKFRLEGEKLQGGWTLVRMHGHAADKQEPWLLIKERDDAARPATEFSVVDELPDSVLRHAATSPARKASSKATKPAKTTRPAKPATNAGPSAGAEPAALHTEAVVAKKVRRSAVGGKSSKPRAKAGGPVAGASIRVTHPERVVDAGSGATKQDVVDYYLAAARLMLPHLASRPVALTRAPAGIEGHLFFQKHAETLKIPGLTRLDPAFDPDHAPMVEIDNIEALMGAAQMNVIEFHTWNSLSTRIEQPDRMTFDLDPGDGVAWPQMAEAAALTKAMLDELGLPSFLKTSGGKGLHIVVPIAPRLGWDTVKAFSKAIVEHLASVVPQRFVAKSGPGNRVGKIFIDYLRNGRGATTACAFSLRARPKLGVSIPCRWDELPQLTAGDQWTIRNAGERLELDIDPWAGYGRARPSLGAAMKKLGFSAGRAAV